MEDKMIIEKHEVVATMREAVFDIYEVEDIELLDKSIGKIKRKTQTVSLSSLVSEKERIEASLKAVEDKIEAINAFK